MRGGVSVATLTAARALVAGRCIPTPTVLLSGVAAFTCSQGSNLPNASAYVVEDRLDLPCGHILVVPSEPDRRPPDGHLEAEVLRRTTLGLLAPWPQPALVSVSLLR